MNRPPELRLHHDEIIVDNFAGGGGASVGIEWALGRSPDIAINHDPQAVAMHAANHPSTTHFTEDVWKVDPVKVCGGRPVGLAWFSPDCFPAGTLVLTGRGYMPIEQIEVGDAVLTHKGRWRHVTEVSSTARQIMTVKGHGHPGLRVSPEHPFYARISQRAAPYWMPAGALERGEFWATPVNFPAATPPSVPGRGMSPDARLMWLAGRYLGDGWTRITHARAEVVITCGKHEADQLRVTLAAWPRAGLRAGADELSWSERPTRTAYQFATNHRGLVQWLREHFGHRAEAKTVPAWALGMPLDLRHALLDGYLSADGHRTTRFVECRTVSKALAYGVKALAASLGHTVTVYTGKNTNRIEGRTVEARDYFLLRWRHVVDKAHRQTFRAGCLEWSPIREVGPRSVGTDTVYNLGVAEDESYVVEGIVVHNCKHFSKAKGGKPVSKKIRGLAWIVVKWAKLVKPRVICLENVEEFQDWGPLGEDDRPDKLRKGLTFQRWKAQLENLGYEVEWRELVAADYGAPTTRKRLFLVARCDRQPIRWPTPTHDPRGRGLPKWRAAAECIDWSLPCHSIFLTPEEAKPLGIRRPLADNTMRRIYRGLMKFVINNPQPFIVGLAHGEHKERPGTRSHGVDQPVRTINAQGNDFAVVAPHIAKFRGDSAGTAADEPLHTITAGPAENPAGAAHAMAIVSAGIVPLTHQGAERIESTEEPMRTITGAHRGEKALATAYVTRIGQTGGGDQVRSAEAPVSTVTSKAEHLLVTPYLAGVGGRSVEQPVSTITAGGSNQQLVASSVIKLKGTCQHGQQMDLPLATVQAEGNHLGAVNAFMVAYYGNEKDGQPMLEPMRTLTARDRLGLVMVHGEPYVITDIGMRMLVPRELYTAQGFPTDYRIEITYKSKPLPKDAQVRMCGNSVSPYPCAALVLAQFAEADEAVAA